MFQLLLLFALLFSIGFTVFIFVFFNKSDESVEVFEEVRNPDFMQVLVPRENDKTPLASEQMFASLHGILRDAKKSLDMLSFEIISSGEEGIKFYVVCPQHLSKFVEGQIYAQYPNAVISHEQDPAQRPVKTQLSTGEPYQAFVTAGEIELEKDFIFPVRTFRDFEVDPLAAITGAMADLKEGEDIWLQLLVRPVANYWQESSKDYISAVKDGRDPTASTGGFGKFFGDMATALSKVNTSPGEPTEKKEVVQLAPGQDEELRQIEEKMLKPGFEIGLRVITKSGDQFTSEQLLRNVVASFKQFTTSHLNGFLHRVPDGSGEEIYTRYLKRYLVAEPLDIVNIEELASIFHLPNVSVETPNIHWSRARKAEPPLDLPIIGTDEDISAFGETDYRGERMVFGMKRPDRRRHMYVLGKTGVGKSSTFKNMIAADILRGEGVCYIDPHGQDIDELLTFIPPQRVKDVVYFDPSDTQFPIGFNMLELDDLSQRDLVTDGVVSVFKKQFEDSWGPRLQYILQNTVATCIEAQGTTILAVQRMLIDKNYRKFVLKHVNDPILLKFWEDEFEKMSQNSRLITEAVAPIQNKVGRFISSAVIRNIVGQVNSTIDLREIMDSKKILLVNLAQGKIGEESASLLGGMIITRLQSAAMARVDIPEDQRSDFYLYVDEFQNFATDSFAKILSEARKFRLNLTMTNQYIEQIPLSVRNAIFGNVGTMCTFVVSQADASLLANEYTPVFDAEDLVSLEAHSMYVKLCIDGMTSTPFSAKSLDYKKRLSSFGQREQIIEYSRQQYGVPKDEIEARILKWSNQKYSEKGNRSLMDSDGKPQPQRGQNKYDKKQGDRKKQYPKKKYDDRGGRGQRDDRRSPKGRSDKRYDKKKPPQQKRYNQNQKDRRPRKEPLQDQQRVQQAPPNQQNQQPREQPQNVNYQQVQAQPKVNTAQPVEIQQQPTQMPPNNQAQYQKPTNVDRATAAMFDQPQDQQIEYRQHNQSVPNSAASNQMAQEEYSQNQQQPTQAPTVAPNNPQNTQSYDGNTSGNQTPQIKEEPKPIPRPPVIIGPQG